MTTAAIIVAAGQGTRMGGGVPKQWRALGGSPVALHALNRFAAHPAITQIILVVAAEATTIPDALPNGVEIVYGGTTRQASVANGLAAVTTDTVLIHDAARPLVSTAIISEVIAALQTAPAAAPALPLCDALWHGTQSGQTTQVTGTQDRTGLYRAQTPQGFHTNAIRTAHAAFTGTAADDVEIARAHGIPVTITLGDETNFKLTYPADFDRAETLLQKDTNMRIGNGYDVHRFGPGDHVTLCGLAIPHTRGLQGHSDADVGMHAVTDAIYGALAMGDIGQHFPPSDPQWKGAASHIFLRHACDLAREHGYEIANADCTLICEVPKIGPHAPQMRAVMAEIMGLDPSQVSVKATTSEQLGFTGRGEGIAAQASILLVSA